MAATANLPTHAQLVVIGAGPGGYHAAFNAADLGLQVVLIDPAENPGGVCLYRGCIPSKALLHAAKVVNEAAEATEIGVTFAPPKIDLDRVRDWKNEIITKLTSGLGMQVGQKNITHIRGTAQLTGTHSLLIKTKEGSPHTLEFEQAILATGSHPIMLPGLAPSPRIMDSTDALDLEDVPESLLVVGGGYIGLELGSAYAALGSKVSVVEMTQGLLPGCDRDLVSILKRRIDKKFQAIMLNTKVAGIVETPPGIQVTFEDKKGSREEVFSKVLIAIGRRPNTPNLGLETVGITPDEKGFVAVDAQRRTSQPHIFAIGDIAGEPMLAHKAYREADVASAAAAGHKAVYDPRAIPAVVFTDPEIAWCGLTETEARAQDRKVKTTKRPWRGNGRTLTLGRQDGLTKLITDPESGVLLGMAMAGPGAGELIAEGVLALEMAATGEDLATTIHPHPTLSETIYETARLL